MMHLPRLVPFLSIAFAAALSAQDQPPTGKPATDKPAAEKASKDKVDFAAQVWPILESSCVECHAAPHVDENGKKTRPKGNVILDTKDGITSSKKGKLVVAKKPNDSLLYEAITRAPDAKKRMPPAKKAEPLTKEQTDLIKKWLEQGASFGTWTGKKNDKTDDKKKDDKKDAAGDKSRKNDEKGKSRSGEKDKRNGEGTGGR
ncbi:MAG: c-type cytochrome domain-containing protein [Planctomycetota bacterium]